MQELSQSLLKIVTFAAAAAFLVRYAEQARSLAHHLAAMLGTGH